MLSIESPRSGRSPPSRQRPQCRDHPSPSAGRPCPSAGRTRPTCVGQASQGGGCREQEPQAGEHEANVARRARPRLGARLGSALPPATGRARSGGDRRLVGHGAEVRKRVPIGDREAPRRPGRRGEPTPGRQPEAASGRQREAASGRQANRTRPRLDDGVRRRARAWIRRNRHRPSARPGGLAARSGERRQELERIVVVARPRVANPEVQVRPARRAAPGGADRPDSPAAPHYLTAANGDAREVQVRGVVASIGGPDADDEPGPAHAPGERHAAGCGREGRSPDRRRDVDAAVLAGCIRVGAVPVRGDDRPAHGPAPADPGGRRRRRDQQEEEGKEGGAERSHRAPSVGWPRRRGKMPVAVSCVFVAVP